jgi:uncharacterized surface protein with fasciclin (FAS1) repeats
MRKRTVMLGLAAGLAAVAVAPATTTPAGAQAPTIASVLLADAGRDDASGFDRNWHDYDIVTQAVLLFPDLVAAASDPAAQLTVLAPNDQAFRLLAQQLTGRGLRTEGAVFEALAGLGTGTVSTVLRYHIVATKLPPAAVLASDGVAVTSLSDGATFSVDVINPRVAFVQFVDGDPNARNPFLRRISVGGELANGFIHGIDRVLRPIDL